MSGVRDSQRSKLFAAEEAVGGPTLSTSAAEAFANKVVNSAWWKKRVPYTSVIATQSSKVRCVPGGERIWKGAGRVPLIYVGPKSKMDLLHELAHISTPTDGVALHGPEFVREYLNLIERFVSKTAKDNFITVLRGHGVKTRTWSNEARAQAKERALKNGTPFGTAKLERTKDEMVSLMQELMSGSETPALSDEEVERRAREAAQQMIQVVMTSASLKAVRNSILGYEERERVEAALKNLADTLCPTGTD